MPVEIIQMRRHIPLIMSRLVVLTSSWLAGKTWTQLETLRPPGKLQSQKNVGSFVLIWYLSLRRFYAYQVKPEVSKRPVTLREATVVIILAGNAMGFASALGYQLRRSDLHFA